MDLTQANLLAVELMQAHGLTAPTWTFKFDNARRRFGLCRFRRSLTGFDMFTGPTYALSGEIHLSRPLTRIGLDADVRDTILHEIAHALAGPTAGHGPKWKAVCERIGARGTRCGEAKIEDIPAPWVAVCAAGHVAKMFRRPQRQRSCGKCSPRFDPKYLLTYERKA